ncbi:unnamed protein product [Ectocarpus sp. 12 AP-2014]
MPVAADGNGALPKDDNAFRLAQYRDAVELQTAAYMLRPRTAEDAVEIVLVSMVHLADQAYYTEIMRDASRYDRVLFELIAGPGVSELDADGNRAVTEYVYPTREQDVLARNYGLSAQLNCLNYCHLCKERTDDGKSSSSSSSSRSSRRNGNSGPRWVLADLTRDKIRSLQQQAGEKEIGQGGWQGFIDEVTRALVVGRQAGDKILPKFFPPLGSSLNRPALVLRALLWLAPCPEAEIMCYDWARSYPRAGGLSVLASAIAESVLSGDFFTAKKLGFAQQIVSGQAGGGNWGQSDEIVVKARNQVVVEETERALAEGCRKIMVLYGGLHMQDLTSQLCKQLDATQDIAGWRTAWVVPTRARQKTNAATSPVPPRMASADAAAGRLEQGQGQVAMLGDETNADGVARWGPLGVAALAYVAVGAWDWTDTVEALARELETGGPPLEAFGSALLVFTLYVARHAYLYYGLARWLVQWEKKLF